MIWYMSMMSLIHSIEKEGAYDKGLVCFYYEKFQNQFYPGSTQSS